MNVSTHCLCLLYDCAETGRRFRHRRAVEDYWYGCSRKQHPASKLPSKLAFNNHDDNARRRLGHQSSSCVIALVDRYAHANMHKLATLLRAEPRLDAAV